ncbi:hypothetical protein G6F24_014495 [Rhizopus arrhizus]|nr:hypothetical protein G6F24_014495 [Rhizopus arrhizus]
MPFRERQGGQPAVLVHVQRVVQPHALPVDDGGGGVDQAAFAGRLVGIVEGHALALGFLLRAVLTVQVTGARALVVHVVDVGAALEVFARQSEAVAPFDTLLQLHEEALLVVVFGAGLAALGAITADVAAVVDVVAVAHARLHQPEGVAVDLTRQRGVGAPAGIGGIVVGLGQCAERLAVGQEVGRIQCVQVSGGGQGAGAAPGRIRAAHDIQPRQAVEVHGLQAALHAARAIVQPRQADAVHAREHAVLVQAADVDAVGRAFLI